MLVTKANVDSSGMVGGFPIHDANLLELEYRRSESIYLRCIHPTGKTLHARFNEPGEFGMIGFRGDAILSEVFLWDLASVPEAQLSGSDGAWNVLFGGDLPATDLPAAARARQRKAQYSTLALISCSYGGTMALLCNSVNMVAE
jgi:hypothetical protein